MFSYFVSCCSTRLVSKSLIQNKPGTSFLIHVSKINTASCRLKITLCLDLYKNRTSSTDKLFDVAMKRCRSWPVRSSRQYFQAEGVLWQKRCVLLNADSTQNGTRVRIS